MKLRYGKLKEDDMKLLKEIDRGEIIKESYIYKNDELKLKDDFYDLKEWTQEDIDDCIDNLNQIYKSHGFIYGAFNRDDIIGIAALDKRSLDDEKTEMNLDLIYINQKFRKMDIGKTLMNKLIKEIKKSDI